MVLLLLGAASARAEVEVRSAGDRVDVRATASPMTEVLERLSRETGMRIVYEGPRPRQLVSASLEKRTLVEAILELLEGTGLSFALQMDPSGTRCQTLIMVSTAEAASKVAKGASTPVALPGWIQDTALEESVPTEDFTPPPGMVMSAPQVVEAPGPEGKSPDGNGPSFPPGFNTAPPSFQGGPPSSPGPVPSNIPAGVPGPARLERPGLRGLDLEKKEPNP